MEIITGIQTRKRHLFIMTRSFDKRSFILKLKIMKGYKIHVFLLKT